MTLRKNRRGSYTETSELMKKTYASKPKAAPALKISRVCLRLDCQRNFIGKGPYQRLCELHRDES